MSVVDPGFAARLQRRHGDADISGRKLLERTSGTQHAAEIGFQEWVAECGFSQGAQ